MGTKAKPETAADLSPEEKARRNACRDQAGRIKGYLPVLRAREEALLRELAETQEHIRRELKAFDELIAEADETPEVAA